mmetsp:Transcript_87766/g.139383  ORF Transcript_87766/g.139383 Transcript_87766/m.139383 type:complete len:362 (-) Transcript_87766:755-1840(-)
MQREARFRYALCVHSELEESASGLLALIVAAVVLPDGTIYCSRWALFLSNIPKPSEACVRRRWDDTPVRNVIYTMFLHDLCPNGLGRTLWPVVLEFHSVDVGRKEVALHDFRRRSVPACIDVVLFEHLLKIKVVVQQVQLALVGQKVRGQRQTVLFLVHGKLKSNGTAHHFSHVLAHQMLHLWPGAATGIRAFGLEGSQVAAKFSKEEGHRDVFKVFLDLIIRRILEVVSFASSRIYLITPGVDVEAVHINGIILVIKLAGQIGCDFTTVACTHVDIGIDQRNTSHSLPAFGLVSMHVAGQGFDARKCRPAILVVLCQLIRHSEQQCVVVPAELLHDLLGKTESVHANISISFDLLCVAIG